MRMLWATQPSVGRVYSATSLVFQNGLKGDAVCGGAAAACVLSPLCLDVISNTDPPRNMRKLTRAFLQFMSVERGHSGRGPCVPDSGDFQVA